MQLKIRKTDVNYLVYLNDNSEKILRGNLKSKWFKSTCILYDNENEIKLLIETIFKFRFWRVKFRILLPTLKLDSYLIPIKLFKGHWRLIHGGDIFDFYLHKGHKKSLFKNGTQIASYNGSSINILNSHTFLINCNNNENIELILSFQLCFDIITPIYEQSTVTFDLGNIFKRVREFDINWRPSQH